MNSVQTERDERTGEERQKTERRERQLVKQKEKKTYKGNNTDRKHDNFTLAKSRAEPVQKGQEYAISQKMTKKK